MVGLGTLVNVVAIVIGTIAGLIIKSGIPEKIRNTVMHALGLAIVMIGISGALAGIFRISPEGTLQRDYILLLIISLVVGGVIGEIIDIDKNLERLAIFIQKKFNSNDSNFIQGFVSSTLLYCVGAMAVVGSLEEGLFNNPATLFAKSVLDGVSAVIFSATLGIGVLFSAIPVGLYQGSITFLATFVRPWLNPVVISQTSMVGSVLIFAIGLNLLNITKLKIANLLPSIFIPFIYYFFLSLMI